MPDAMNPTDHAAKRAKLVQERDAAKANADKLALVYRAEVEKLDAELDALDATPAYPSVTFIDPKTRTQNFVTFRDGAFYVGSGSRPWYTAVELAHHLVEVEKLDEFVTRLLTLKGAAVAADSTRSCAKPL